MINIMVEDDSYLILSRWKKILRVNWVHDFTAVCCLKQGVCLRLWYVPELHTSIKRLTRVEPLVPNTRSVHGAVLFR